MPPVVIYFQVHQPFRLRRYSIYDATPDYFDDAGNREVLLRIADQCYRPATLLMLRLAQEHEGRFRFAFSLTGTVLDQLEQWAPEVIDAFRRVADTGCCEFLGETEHHSLASLHSPEEFDAEVRAHTDRITRLFGAPPRVFRNTELIYANDLAAALAGIEREGGPAFDGVLCEPDPLALDGRSPDRVYRTPAALAPGRRPHAVLTKNPRLSDEIAFRFGQRSWGGYPLLSETFAGWISAEVPDAPGAVCNLFMDYETLGEHQWRETGILDFFAALPAAVIDRAPPDAPAFLTPSEAIAEINPDGEYDAPRHTSWADSERDLSAWTGNSMQTDALRNLYRIESLVKGRAKAASSADDPDLKQRTRDRLRDWRRLATSDHFYYMGTKFEADGESHRYFSPYDSPYDAYINYMNVLDNLRTRLEAILPADPPGPAAAGATPTAGE